jgi:hypothetical protein
MTTASSHPVLFLPRRHRFSASLLVGWLLLSPSGFVGAAISPSSLAATGDLALLAATSQRQEVIQRMAMSASYSIIPKGKYAADKPTPEAVRQRASEIIRLSIPSQAEIDHAIRTRSILNRAGNRIYLDAETIVINGRVWSRTAKNESYGRVYAYNTVLSSDRMLGILFRMPQYDYNANPDSAGYPAALKRAFADMEAMVASFRIAKQNDDGTPDPFVIERVAPAPLPVREKLTTP